MKNTFQYNYMFERGAYVCLTCLFSYSNNLEYNI
jgi:hypothetical protein